MDATSKILIFLIALLIILSILLLINKAVDRKLDKKKVELDEYVERYNDMRFMMSLDADYYYDDELVQNLCEFVVKFNKEPKDKIQEVVNAERKTRDCEVFDQFIKSCREYKLISDLYFYTEEVRDFYVDTVKGIRETAEYKAGMIKEVYKNGRIS